jgi:isocitrate/isopropylmalate dehydrogenase
LSKVIANLIGAIWSGTLMLEHLGEKDAAEFISRAIEKTVADGILPVDLSGTAMTGETGARAAKSVQTL